MASANSVEVVLDETTMERLEVRALWRSVSVADLARAYIEDWIDIDYPESQGRLTRRGIHRDGPIGLDPDFLAPGNWRKDLEGKPVKRKWD